MAENAAPKAQKSVEEAPAKVATPYEFEPPLASVRKVVKAALPEGVKMGSDTTQAFAKAAGIFIHYLTSCANDFCRENKRSTISADDVLEALKELEFGEMVEPLQEFLQQFKTESAEKKKATASKKAEAEERAKAAAETSPEAGQPAAEASPAAASTTEADPTAEASAGKAATEDGSGVLAMEVEGPVATREPDAPSGADTTSAVEAAADATVAATMEAPEAMVPDDAEEPVAPAAAADVPDVSSTPQLSQPAGDVESAVPEADVQETEQTGQESQTLAMTQDSVGDVEESMDMEASSAQES